MTEEYMNPVQQRASKRECASWLRVVIEPVTTLTTIERGRWPIAMLNGIAIGCAGTILGCVGLRPPPTLWPVIAMASIVTTLMYCFFGAVLLSLSSAIVRRAKPDVLLALTCATYSYAVLGIGRVMSGLLLAIEAPKVFNPSVLMVLPSLALLTTNHALATFLYQYNPFAVWWYALLAISLNKRFNIKSTGAVVAVAVGSLAIALLEVR